MWRSQTPRFAPPRHFGRVTFGIEDAALGGGHQAICFAARDDCRGARSAKRASMRAIWLRS